MQWNVRGGRRAELAARAYMRVCVRVRARPAGCVSAADSRLMTGEHTGTRVRCAGTGLARARVTGPQ